MTKNKALFAWFNELMPFYRASAVPSDVTFPYGTYEWTDDDWYGESTSCTVNMWFHTESEAEPDEYAAKLSALLVNGGVTVPCDEGVIWIKKGTPYCQSLVYQDDPSIKRRYINLTIDYLTL